MIRACVICEGQTEMAFIKEVLEPHLRISGLEVVPALLKSRPGKQGGGAVSAARIAQHVKHFYKDFDYLTTLVDFYAFQGGQGHSRHSLELSIMETALQALKQDELPRFKPYIQMHEFEGLLFSDVAQFEWVLLDEWGAHHRRELQSVKDEFETPEMINDGPATAPSKRLEHVFGRAYDKVEHGSIIAAEIGLDNIRKECPNFDKWLSWLESLGAEPTVTR